ncbi:MAG: alkaline phosphatase D family protein [Thiotrichales bacterium]
MVQRVRVTGLFQLAGVVVLVGLMSGCASARLIGGPMAGHSETHAALIWLMTDREANASIEYWPETQPNARKRSGIATTSAAEGHAAQISLQGLDPDVRYTYRVLLDGRLVAGDPRHRFVTQPLHRDTPRDLRLAAGSCAHIALDATGPDSARFSTGYAIFDRIAAQKPDAMLWLGDSIYFRDTDFVDDPRARMNARWAITRAFEPLQNLLQTGHHYAIWDDHDYGPNNSNRAFEHKQLSLELFQRYWPQSTYGLEAVPGTFIQTSIADVDLFLLDDRFHRDDDNAPDTPGKGMFGAAQLDWLKQALMRSTATYKLVVSGSRLLAEPISPERRGGEGWHNFPHEREAFLRWLDERRIEGVVMLSGDVHYTYLATRERPTAYPLYELVCSPLTSRVHPRPRPVNELPGTFVAERNFCTLEFNGPITDRRLRISSWNALGERLWSEEIMHSALRLR